MTISACFDAETLSSAENGRRWFVNQEVALLRYRLEILARNRQRTWRFHQIYHWLTAKNLRKRLDPCPRWNWWILDQSRIVYPNANRYSQFYNVPGTCLDMVAKRSVPHARGRAFPYAKSCVSIISQFYKEELGVSLEAICQGNSVPARGWPHCPAFWGFETLRLQPDASMASSSSGLCWTNSLGGYWQGFVHFRFVAQHLYRNLRADRHLKLNGRQQYGLFLKSIGLSLSEAFDLWRTAFIPATRLNNSTRITLTMSVTITVKKVKSEFPSQLWQDLFRLSCFWRISRLSFKHAGIGWTSLQYFILVHWAKWCQTYWTANLKLSKLAVDESHYQVACTRVFEYTRPVKNFCWSRNLSALVLWKLPSIFVPLKGKGNEINNFEWFEYFKLLIIMLILLNKSVWLPYGHFAAKCRRNLSSNHNPKKDRQISFFICLVFPLFSLKTQTVELARIKGFITTCPQIQLQIVNSSPVVIKVFHNEIFFRMNILS